MDTGVAQAVRFRHVVFPDSVGGYGRAMNVAPRLHHPEAGPNSAAPPPSRPAPRLSADEESFLCGLFARVGLSARQYKPETLHRRLPACLRALRASSVPHARSILQRNPGLAWAAVGAVVIGVTSFFRDGPVFEALRHRVLPRLLRERERGGGRLRVWSVGCSDGAELYSVAMLLDACGTLSGGKCELLGTDCRPEAVARAAAGYYDPAAVKGVPPDLLRRYFMPEAGQYQVAPALQDAVRWRVADALAPGAAAPGAWDLVLCRNLIIYLQPEATAALWATFQAALRVGGVLVLGKAERPVGVAGLSPDGSCLYRRNDG